MDLRARKDAIAAKVVPLDARRWACAKASSKSCGRLPSFERCTTKWAGSGQSRGCRGIGTSPKAFVPISRSRAELFKTDATRKAITFHDLRATGITWMAIRGDEPLRIMQRTGHDDFDTTQRYIREAEAVREGLGEVFPPLTTLLKPRPDRPEWSTIGPRRRDFDRLRRGVSRRYVAGWTGLARSCTESSRFGLDGVQDRQRPGHWFARSSANRAGWTGLEPAASGVTGRRYNQLNYHPKIGDSSLRYFWASAPRSSFNFIRLRPGPRCSSPAT
jgi:hypothetical protein